MLQHADRGLPTERRVRFTEAQVTFTDPPSSIAFQALHRSRKCPVLQLDAYLGHAVA